MNATQNLSRREWNRVYASLLASLATLPSAIFVCAECDSRLYRLCESRLRPTRKHIDPVIKARVPFTGGRRKSLYSTASKVASPPSLRPCFTLLSDLYAYLMYEAVRERNT
jgi:hypothetical protein